MALDLLFLNGELVDQSDQVIDFQDRAFHYGDGVFETLRIHRGDIPMWDFHRERLLLAQEKLKLPIDKFLAQWPRFIAENLKAIESGCAKLIISRGVGPRGYKPPDVPALNWWLKITDLPEDSLNLVQSNKKLTICQHPLSRQPVLAGLKHLNRLDQIMARSEWGSQNEFDEGIMLDIDGAVTECTMSNIFWLRKKQVYTPDLSLEGVDGCVRRWLIHNLASTPKTLQVVKSVKLECLLSADAVFISNSLIGIQLVSNIAGHQIPLSDLVKTLSDEFNQQYFLD
ncbi:MAG: aminodeoxychorismate lyase [Oleispira sp.]|nr:aminodeoxychorismate lyase [Oleispira sp.]MBL4882192.1 aminodeoxychorismate lyase [Oleispira sp.]